MSRVIALDRWSPGARGARRSGRRTASAVAAAALPRVLAGMIEAGLQEAALAAISAWGRGETTPEDILDWCHTCAAVAGVRDVLECFGQADPAGAGSERGASLP